MSRKREPGTEGIVILHRKLAALFCALALVLALSACGSNGNNEEAASGEAPLVAEQELVIKASNWQFDQTEYKIPKNTPVEIKLVNDQGAHGIQIKDAGVKLNAAKDSKVVSLDAGTYEIKCNIVCGTGHLNMTAKLIVE
ncbi:cupredoxin domain-containing protein [Cohnella thailandensis]|uniref:Cupredoxin domain-containing protein n=1 Tax=Cohnella thailandensis TaxID=557557 RepID=A0A841SR73_9BACL|nr:cupredoxin domain-containing protein [Cohnella thailandensis]